MNVNLSALALKGSWFLSDAAIYSVITRKEREEELARNETEMTLVEVGATESETLGNVNVQILIGDFDLDSNEFDAELQKLE